MTAGRHWSRMPEEPPGYCQELNSRRDLSTRTIPVAMRPLRAENWANPRRTLRSILNLIHALSSDSTLRKSFRGRPSILPESLAEFSSNRQESPLDVAEATIERALSQMGTA